MAIRTGVLALVLVACNGTTPAPRDVMPDNAPGATPPATTALDEEPPPPVDGPKLMPVDEATSDPQLEQFRQALIEYVEAEDIDRIVAAADTGIRTSFGGGGGRDDFRKMLERPGMLEELEQVLELGGTFRGEGADRSFWTPYVYSEWPEDVDAFEHVAVIGEQVSLFEEPDASSPPIASLSYDILRTASPMPEQEGWRQVTTADGRTGWIEDRHVRSPVDYRAGLVRDELGWKINIFVAGD